MPYVYAVGELPGDFGFDPLRLGENKEALQWYQQAELQNGRQVQPILMPLDQTLCFLQWLGSPTQWHPYTKSQPLDL